MTPDEKRTQLQRDAVTALLRDRCVMVGWGTGVGKSRVGIMAADILFKAGAYRILLLVDQSSQKDNWLKEFMDCKGETDGRYLYDSLTVECYASLPSLEGTQWDLVIADEAHHLRSEGRCTILSTIRSERFLGLTATISCNGDGDELVRIINETFGKMTSLDFGIQDAIDNYILGRPDIHVHVLPLEEISVRHDIVLSWGASAKRKALTCKYEERFEYFDREKYPDAVLTMDCSSAEAYEYWTAQCNRLTGKWRDARKAAGLSDGDKDTKATRPLYNMKQQAALQRKNVIGRSKTTFANWLVQRRLKDRKLICFCNDVDQACRIGGEHVIFSERESNLGRIEQYTDSPAELFEKSSEVIDAFNKGDIRSIFAVNMLVEGHNLDGIQTGVAVQLSGKDRRFVQELGRAMRAKDPEQHIIVVDGTRDVDYLQTALSVINHDYVTFTGYGRLKGVKALEDLSNGEAPQRPVVAERFSMAAARKAAEENQRKDSRAVSSGAPSPGNATLV